MITEKDIEKHFMTRTKILELLEFIDNKTNAIDEIYQKRHFGEGKDKRQDVIEQEIENYVFNFIEENREKILFLDCEEIFKYYYKTSAVHYAEYKEDVLLSGMIMRNKYLGRLRFREPIWYTLPHQKLSLIFSYHAEQETENTGFLIVIKNATNKTINEIFGFNKIKHSILKNENHDVSFFDKEITERFIDKNKLIDRFYDSNLSSYYEDEITPDIERLAMRNAEEDASIYRYNLKKGLNELYYSSIHDEYLDDEHEQKKAENYLKEMLKLDEYYSRLNRLMLDSLHCSSCSNLSEYIN